MNNLTVLLSFVVAGCTLPIGTTASDGGNGAPDDSGGISCLDDGGTTPRPMPDGGYAYGVLPPTVACGSTVTCPPSAPVVAVWGGWTSNPPPGVSSDQVLITLRQDGGGHTTGTIVYGAKAPPPAPMNNDDCSGVPKSVGPIGLSPSDVVVEGFAFPIRDSIVTSTRLRVVSSRAEAYRAICECQVPIPQSNAGGWACLPNVGGEISGTGDFCAVNLPSGLTPVSCCRYTVCGNSGVCACNSTGCTVGGSSDIVIDLAVNGDHADGSDGKIGGDVHLTLMH